MKTHERLDRTHTGAPARILCVAAAIALLALAIAGCGSDNPGSPPVDDTTRLAGGGREASDDPFVGGSDDSGLVPPGDMPDFVGGLIPVFYSVRNCEGVAFERVITDSDTWVAWWTAATACDDFAPDPEDDPPPPTLALGEFRAGDDDSLPDDRPPDDPTFPPGDPADTGWVEPDTGWTDPGYPGDPWAGGPPQIDFTRYVIVVIGLDTAPGWGRSLQVTEASLVAGVATVRYQVATLGEDCRDLLMGPFIPESIETSPVIAVLVEKPFDLAPVFARSDTVWNCTWAPDPNEPLTIYYSDTECALGDDEQVFTDAARWESWLATATACDIDRWNDDTKPPLPDGVDGDDAEGGVEPGVPPTLWIGVDVDFTTHAVIVLRSVTQSRWGGGIWLNAIDKSGAGTRIDYSVMQPSDDCPPIEGDFSMRPTVAIRVPLPLASPVTFTRNVETIDCRWDGVEPVDGDDADGGIGSGDVSGDDHSDDNGGPPQKPNYIPE
ncbi:MAG: hypothetical protein ACKVU1_00805 [bacterium]